MLKRLLAVLHRGGVPNVEPSVEARPRGDRGGGIHVRGGFRIGDLQLSFDATTGELADSSMITELRTDIFEHWLRIAEQAAGDAEAARQDALDAPLNEIEPFN